METLYKFINQMKSYAREDFPLEIAKRLEAKENSPDTRPRPIIIKVGKEYKFLILKNAKKLKDSFF